MVYHGYIHSFVAFVMCCRYSESCVSKGYWRFLGNNTNSMVFVCKRSTFYYKSRCFHREQVNGENNHGFYGKVSSSAKARRKSPRSEPKTANKSASEE